MTGGGGPGGAVRKGGVSAGGDAVWGEGLKDAEKRIS